MLSAGILYGIFHQSRLSKKEAAFREVDDKRKAIRDKQLALEKKLAADGKNLSLFLCNSILIINLFNKLSKGTLFLQLK